MVVCDSHVAACDAAPFPNTLVTALSLQHPGLTWQDMMAVQAASTEDWSNTPWRP
jgi:hypothetical protein